MVNIRNISNPYKVYYRIENIAKAISTATKYFLFEPNDESSPETYKIIQFLTEDPEKENKVYASHNSNLLMKIKEIIGLS